MKRAVLALLLVAAFLVAWHVGVAANEVITIRAWTVGPDTPAFHRAENLIAAAERLNQILEAAGADLRVEVEADFWTDSWDSFRRRIILTAEEGDPAIMPDIILSSHMDIPVWAEAGWIAPLDHYIAQYWEGTYQDFYPHLWDAVSYGGQIYGVPQDIEVRMVYYRKDHLRALGWSEEDIASLPQRVANKEFLLTDLQELAQAMQEAGLVDYGLLHRPTEGPDFFQFVVAFGGEYYDSASGKLIVDRAALRQTLEFFADNVHKYKITPSGMTTWPWPAVHRATAEEGSAGVNITGGMWNWAEWQRDLGIPEGELWENLTWSLIPAGSEAGRPNQLGHPVAYMVTQLSDKKDLAFLLITIASDVDLNTRHSLAAAKLAIRRSQTAFAPFVESEFLAAASELLPQQIFMAAHPASGHYAAVLHEAISGVEVGALTPDEGVELIVQRMQQVAGEDVLVR